MTTANPVQGQVPPNPPGAPPQGGPPQPQQPPQRPLPPSVTHQLGIEATPSKKEPQATASFQKQDQEREITVKKQLDWSGQKYTFTIHLPLENPLHTMSKSERMQFQKQADDLAELMIQDLKQQLDAQYKNGKASGKKKIEPGDNCRILFDDSGKYIIAHEDDVSSIDPDKPDTFNDKRAYEANGPTSKQIVLAACSKKAEKMYQCLQHESLKPLRMATQKKTAEQAADASPVNLIFKKNSCFIDAPFQQLVTDPTVAKDLINPDYYKDGTDSALYKAVTAYRAAQLKGERVDVASILRNKGLDASGKQLDALLDGWYRFADFFNFDAIPEESKLHDLFTKPCVFTLGKGGKLNDL
ncbi:MAG: hypothetical protein KGQ49_00690, partial [Verrucomicrobia bacterium]|nr:hypothetical protein [Verrucomicrobiota bacterium]